jgi:hypothetical protein
LGLKVLATAGAKLGIDVVLYTMEKVSSVTDPK